MINKTKILLILGSLIFSLIISLPAVQAESSQILSPEAQSALENQDTALIEASGLSTSVTFGEMVSYVIKLLLSFLGVIFIILIIYAGFLWMTSAGNEEKVGQAKKIMVSAVVGLAIIFAAYALTYFVIDQLLEATQGGVGLD